MSTEANRIRELLAEIRKQVPRSDPSDMPEVPSLDDVADHIEWLRENIPRLCDAVKEAVAFIGNDTVAPTLADLATMDDGAILSRITRKTKARLMCSRIRRILEGAK